MDAQAWKARLIELLKPLDGASALRGLSPHSEDLITKLVAAGYSPEAIASQMWGAMFEDEANRLIYGGGESNPVGVLPVGFLNAPR